MRFVADEDAHDGAKEEGDDDSEEEASTDDDANLDQSGRTDAAAPVDPTAQVAEEDIEATNAVHAFTSVDDSGDQGSVEMWRSRGQTAGDSGRQAGFTQSEQVSHARRIAWFQAAMLATIQADIHFRDVHRLRSYLHPGVPAYGVGILAAL